MVTATVKLKKGDEVLAPRGEKTVTTTITGSFKQGPRIYYTTKATGKDKGFPAGRLLLIPEGHWASNKKGGKLMSRKGTTKRQKKGSII